MNKPTIICHMMTSVDGRIDCGMTAKLTGVDEYYATLNGLYAPTRVSGRHTAALEMADKDVVFEPDHAQAYGQEGFSRKTDADAYEVVVDTKGTRRMAVVGGGTINAGFLDAGLLDEVSVLIGPGIDGRGGMTAAFDGLPMDREPFRLKLVESKVFDNGAVFLRYLVKSV